MVLIYLNDLIFQVAVLSGKVLSKFKQTLKRINNELLLLYLVKNHSTVPLQILKKNLFPTFAKQREGNTK